MAYQRSNGHPPGPGHPNGNYGRSPAPEPLRPAQTPQMTAAQAFDDEKKRIIATCFSKMDDRGPIQSYITHIRVEEDGAYPSEPPPPSADPSYKKQRVIIAAVKSTGRLYLHKARENDDRTFQIGKSWPLEELSMIESFSPGVHRSPQDQTRARLAGDIGFVINIAKPYFWKAKTPKEKAFFIGSVVKIYRKYTGGRLPELKGFTQEEEYHLFSASEPTPPQQQQPPPPHQQQRPPASPRTMQPNGSGTLPGPPPPMPYAQRPPGSDSSLPSQRSTAQRRRPSDTADSSLRSPSAASSGRQRPPSPGRLRNDVPPLQTNHLPGLSPAITPTSRSTTPHLRSATSQDSHMRSRPSQDHMRSKTPEGPPRMAYQGSRSNMTSPLPPDDRVPSSRYGSDNRDLSRDPAAKSPSVYGASHDNLPSTTSISSSTAERWKPPGAPGRDRPRTPNESLSPNAGEGARPTHTSERSFGNTLNPAIPERRRPTLDKGTFSAPRETPESIQEESMPPPLRSKKSTPQPSSLRNKSQETLPQPETRIPGAFPSSTPSPAPSAPPPLQTDVSPHKKSTASNDTSSQTRKSEDSKPSMTTGSSAPSSARPSTPENREATVDPTSPTTPKPGLGPMVGRKLTEGSAARWKKVAAAATATSAFKPRAGGAGARLLAEKNKPADEGPDGVTGVVPAPSVRAGGGESIVDRLGSSKRDNAPDLRVTDASPAADMAFADTHDDFLTKGLVPSIVTQKSQPKYEFQYNNALQALDVDPALLGGQGQDYEATLAEFGWSTNVLQSKTIDNMEADMRREIARLEAGPWLGQETADGGHKDSGVEGFETVLDKAIAECDEMERLLSLYGVEMAVCAPHYPHYSLTWLTIW